MNQEFNEHDNPNSESYGYPQEQNMEPSVYQPSQQRMDQSPSTQDRQEYSYSEYSSNTEGDYRNYPTPQVTISEKKPKKRRRFRGAVKFTAAAVAFGLIAGVVFQGFAYVTSSGYRTAPGQGTTVQMPDQTAAPTDENTDDSSVVPVNISSEAVVTDVSGIVENVMPSIVAINSTGTVTSYDFFGREYSQPMQGSGSGIIIGQNNSELLIATNNHVIQDATEVEIVFSDETKVKGIVKGADASSDLAVVSVKMSDLTQETASTIKIAKLGDSSKTKPGEMAIAIGNALGYGQSITVGYISAVNRQVDIEGKKMTLLQTDAAINPGNSGGALINAAGEVIGINSVKYASEEVEGMGFAIPITDAVPMINDLMNREVLAESEQGYLGIYKDSAQNVTEAYAETFHMPIGVYVNDVVAGSPAEKAGLKPGYIIVGIDNKKVETIDDLMNILTYTKAGQTITLKVSVSENGNYVEKDLSVTLGSKGK